VLPRTRRLGVGNSPEALSDPELTNKFFPIELVAIIQTPSPSPEGKPGTFSFTIY